MPNEIIKAVGPKTSQGMVPQNVREAWSIYDTMVISPKWYGSEEQNAGWFSSVLLFSNQETHSFFTARTEATASLAYCNKQTADSMDFVFMANTIGVAFIAPGVRTLCDGSGSGGPAAINQTNNQLAHWWETVLPRHCSLEFKVQQDTVLELPSLAASPGYGPSGGGASFEHELTGRIEPQGAARPDYLPVANFSVTQGVPTLKNRFSFGDQPIGIPRTGTIEAVIRVSELARAALFSLDLQYYYFFGGNPAAPPDYVKFPARFMIQISLLGSRAVQQRAQYFS